MDKRKRNIADLSRKAQPGFLAGYSIVLLLLCTPFSLAAADDAESDAGWLYYGRDQGGARHSPLTQINKTNIDELEVAWTYRHGDLERFPERRSYAGFHATPVLLPAQAGGSLVACSPFSRVFALDPATGKERWSHDPEIELSKVATRLKCLGVAYWQDPAVAEAVPIPATGPGFRLRHRCGSDGRQLDSCRQGRRQGADRRCPPVRYL